MSQSCNIPPLVYPGSSVGLLYIKVTTTWKFSRFGIWQIQLLASVCRYKIIKVPTNNSLRYSSTCFGCVLLQPSCATYGHSN